MKSRLTATTKSKHKGKELETGTGSWNMKIPGNRGLWFTYCSTEHVCFPTDNTRLWLLAGAVLHSGISNRTHWPFRVRQQLGALCPLPQVPLTHTHNDILQSEVWGHQICFSSAISPKRFLKANCRLPPTMTAPFPNPSVKSSQGRGFFSPKWNIYRCFMQLLILFVCYLQMADDLRKGSLVKEELQKTVKILSATKFYFSKNLWMASLATFKYKNKGIYKYISMSRSVFYNKSSS